MNKQLSLLFHSTLDFLKVWYDDRLDEEFYCTGFLVSGSCHKILCFSFWHVQVIMLYLKRLSSNFFSVSFYCFVLSSYYYINDVLSFFLFWGIYTVLFFCMKISCFRMPVVVLFICLYSSKLLMIDDKMVSPLLLPNNIWYVFYHFKNMFDHAWLLSSSGILLDSLVISLLKSEIISGIIFFFITRRSITLCLMLIFSFKKFEI